MGRRNPEKLNAVIETRPLFFGRGRKRPLINVHVEKLNLDGYNPRLPKENQSGTEKEILRFMHKTYDLKELAESMAQNGYFDEEPLVAVPKELPKKFAGMNNLEQNKEYQAFLQRGDIEYIVIEGNRRLSTIKILLSDELRKELNIKDWPKIDRDIESDISILPVIVYSKREDVTPYMGVRHITGTKKWEPFSKATYISDMVDRGFTIEQIKELVGDRGDSVRKFYLAFKIVEKVEKETDMPVEDAKDNFSLLMNAIGQAPIKDYIGLPRRIDYVNFSEPVPASKIDELKNIFSWIFGEGKERSPVIEESRDIPKKICPILRNPDSIAYLLDTRKLEEAFERSGGEHHLIMSQLKQANSMLEKCLGIAHRNITKDVKEEVKKCKDTVEQLIKSIGG